MTEIALLATALLFGGASRRFTGLHGACVLVTLAHVLGAGVVLLRLATG